MPHTLAHQCIQQFYKGRVSLVQHIEVSAFEFQHLYRIVLTLVALRLVSAEAGTLLRLLPFAGGQGT